MVETKRHVAVDFAHVVEDSDIGKIDVIEHVFTEFCVDTVLYKSYKLYLGTCLVFSRR